MNMLKRAVGAVDALQQRHAWLAVPVAVWKKFGDDQAGNLAALIAYSAFVGIFPLLLVAFTVLDLVIKDHPELIGLQHAVNSAVEKYPVIGPYVQHGGIGRLHQTGVALVVGILATFIGALGVANSLQNALNSVWEIPFARRPGFPWSWLRSAALIIVIGLGFVLTTALSGLASGVGHVLPDVSGLSIPAIVVSLLLNFGFFWLGFRLGTAKEITWRQLWLGAAISAVIWQILQTIGATFVARQVAHASPLYGTFALVLGLVAWLYLQAQLTLYAVEFNVVRVYRLWPRSIAPPPLTEQDRQAYELYAKVEKRREEMDVVVAPATGGEDDREQTSG
jgi:membrane protein